MVDLIGILCFIIKTMKTEGGKHERSESKGYERKERGQMKECEYKKKGKSMSKSSTKSYKK